MIEIRGTEGLLDIEVKTSGSGKEYAVLCFTNGLQAATFSTSVISVAKMCKLSEMPFSFIGVVQSREFNGKHYPNLNIDSAWIPKEVTEKTHSAAVAAVSEAKEEENIPF